MASEYGSPVVVDSPEKDGCHGGDVLPSLRDVYTGPDDSITHRIIDEACEGTVPLGVIGDTLRQIRDDMQAGTIPTGPVNVSWGAGDSRNPIRWSLTQYLRDVGSYDRTHPQVIYEDAGGIVVYASGNDDNDTGVSGSAAGMYSIAAGAFNLDTDSVYDFANRWNGLLVDYWADGQAPSGALGTSFAAPRVAGAVANLMRAGLTLWEAKTALYIDSLPISTNGNGDLALLNEAKAKSRTSAVSIAESERMLAAYVVGCGRRADQAGWTWWTDHARKTGLENAAQDFLASAKNGGDWQEHKVPVARRVQAHYHLFVGREADDAGMKWWLEQLAHGRYGGTEESEEYDGMIVAKDDQWYQIDWASFTRDFIQGLRGAGEDVPGFASVFEA
jgi:hypothetical protein